MGRCKMSRLLSVQQESLTGRTNDHFEVAVSSVDKLDPVFCHPFDIRWDEVSLGLLSSTICRNIV